MELNDTLYPHEVNLKFIGSLRTCCSLLTDSVSLDKALPFNPYMTGQSPCQAQMIYRLCTLLEPPSCLVQQQ